MPSWKYRPGVKARGREDARRRNSRTIDDHQTEPAAIIPSTIDPGIFYSRDLIEDPSDAGTYLTGDSGVREDGTDPGTYLIGAPA